MYNRISAPHLGVLVPELDGEGERYLTYVELPFSEDQRDLQENIRFNVQR